MRQEKTPLCVRSTWSKQKNHLSFNSNPSQELNINLRVQFFCSSWREIDHTPELILNHSTPDALNWGLCPLLSKQGQHKGRRTHIHTHLHHAWMNICTHTQITSTSTSCQHHMHIQCIHGLNRNCHNQWQLPVSWPNCLELHLPVSQPYFHPRESCSEHWCIIICWE